MVLAPKIKQFLKAKAHSLKPVVQIGQHGLTEAVHKAINKALRAHELIKIHIAGVDRETKRAMVALICQVNKAEQINIIGNKSLFHCILYIHLTGICMTSLHGHLRHL